MLGSVGVVVDAQATRAAGISGWEQATAIGTVAAAVATLGAVGAALFIAARDRQAAEKQAVADRAAAATLAAAERDASRAERVAEHRLNVLLGYTLALERALTSGGHVADVTAHLAAVPPTSLVAARTHFLGAPAASPVMAHNLRTDPAAVLRAEAQAAMRSAESALRSSRRLDPTPRAKRVTVRLPQVAPPADAGDG